MTFSVQGALDAWVLGIEEPREPDQMWHPSSISGCERQAVFTYTGAEKTNPHSVKASRIFRIGHDIHEKVQDAIMDSDMVADFYPEIEIVSTALRITGHADGLVFLTDGTVELLEIKSINSNALRYGGLPKEDHIWQAMIYAKVLREEGVIVRGIDPLGDKLSTVRFAYVSKDDWSVTEFLVPWSDELDRQIMERLDRLETHLADGTLPERLSPVTSKGERKLPYQCAFCDYKDRCWVPNSTQPTEEN